MSNQINEMEKMELENQETSLSNSGSSTKMEWRVNLMTAWLTSRVKLFEVVAKCGHVGKTKCLMIHFPVIAHSKKEAAEKVKNYSRVKRDHKDCIQSVEEITVEEFYTIKRLNELDPYLHCKSRYQQVDIAGFEERLVDDEYNIQRREIKSSKKESRNYRYKRQECIEKSWRKAMCA